MHFLLGILNGFGEIWAHKLRSFLTTLCVLLGVASLVLIVGFITGLFGYWERYTQEMGGIQKVQVLDQPLPKNQQHLAGISPGKTLTDVDAINAYARHVSAVSPEIQLSSAQLAYHGKTWSPGWGGRVEGVTLGVLKVSQYRVDQGRFISPLDLARADAVVVLGSAVVKALYQANEDPVGTLVRINGEPFRVVGVLHDYRMMDGKYNVLDEKNRVAFVPLSSMQLRLYGSDKLTSLNVQVDDQSHLHDLVDQLNNILFETHRHVRDFKVHTSEEGLKAFNNIRGNFFLVGGGIAAITLVVGGIGIMNLMLASINERVREIGIRKAVGAWNRDIFVQFIAESVCLSTLGGLMGIGLGVGIIRLLQLVMTGTGRGSLSPPVLSPWSVMVGFGFSVLVGMLAGLYPAFRASRLDPIEALRYE